MRSRALQQFFAWCLDEGELDANPMARMRPPVVPERPVPVLGEADAKALLKSYAGTGFVERRDTAIIRLFLDTGMRLNELAKLRLVDVDLDDDVAIVVGKGRRPRACPFGVRTAQALDRYLRARSRHQRSDLPPLWLGANGRTAMTDNGIGQMIRKRGSEAGIHALHPHMLRHTFAHHRLDVSNDSARVVLLHAAGHSKPELARRARASTSSVYRLRDRGHAQLRDHLAIAS